ncbi:hypothetical protein E2C01_078582 [Portunus trituberculatus]|uniref:Uncharacterized protein n=1 Tax=Portunus trituberculatus TaxID=210409 RepID=A0A5B7IJ69_PORTR|nr:hypothetical protein [Portunus trituberculatus]
MYCGNLPGKLPPTRFFFPPTVAPLSPRLPAHTPPPLLLSSFHLTLCPVVAPFTTTSESFLLWIMMGVNMDRHEGLSIPNHAVFHVRDL